MHGQKNTREKGQSLVEFALALPILILIVSGLLDIGRAYFAYIYLEEAAAEAATYLALNPSCLEHGQLGGACDNPNNAIWRARNSGSTIGIIRSDAITITVLDPDAIGYAGAVAVEATVPFQFVTPGIAPMAEAVTGSSTMIFRIVATNMVISSN